MNKDMPKTPPIPIDNIVEHLNIENRKYRSKMKEQNGEQ